MVSSSWAAQKGGFWLSVYLAYCHPSLRRTYLSIIIRCTFKERGANTTGTSNIESRHFPTIGKLVFSRRIVHIASILLRPLDFHFQWATLHIYLEMTLSSKSLLSGRDDSFCFLYGWKWWPLPNLDFFLFPLKATRVTVNVKWCNKSEGTHLKFIEVLAHATHVAKKGYCIISSVWGLWLRVAASDKTPNISSTEGWGYRWWVILHLASQVLCSVPSIRRKT